MESIDLVIIGAGWHGIAMAKTYHEAVPEATIRIVDTQGSVGGCWAAERVYPGLNTNNTLGSYEFSDFPMTPSIADCQHGSHIPGEGVHKYFREAVRYFDLERFLMLSTKVQMVKLQDDDHWKLSYSSTVSPVRGEIIARRLVVATGLTSEPYMPTFKGQEGFHGLRMHSKELKPRAADLAECQNVVVIGGNKSAWDVCYSVARRGGKAHMMLRPSGGGPSWVWPPRFKWFGWQTSLPKMVMTRLFGLFDPWPFVGEGNFWRSIRNFLHQSALGLMITSVFWRLLGRQVRRINGYRNHGGTAKLEPWYSTYWMGHTLSTLNYPSDWFEFARKGNIQVHHANVVSLSETCVRLTDGTIEGVDALVCCTGWSAAPPVDFQPLEIRELIGIPMEKPQSDEMLCHKARDWILDTRPHLRNPSRITSTPEKQEKLERSDQTTPYRLYRFVVPSSDGFLASRNLAFIGIDSALPQVIIAQAQALWITAFFQDRLLHLHPSNLDHEQVVHDTIVQSEYQHLRRPRVFGGVGEKHPDMVFESILYVDMLLKDLGLETQRKQGWWRDLTEHYSVKDYTDLVQEWMRSQKEQSRVADM